MVNIARRFASNGTIFVVGVSGMAVSLLVFSQSAWLDATANALGITTSNGLELVLGIF